LGQKAFDLHFAERGRDSSVYFLAIDSLLFIGDMAVLFRKVRPEIELLYGGAEIGRRTTI
jgi:hypothetical protein